MFMSAGQSPALISTLDFTIQYHDENFGSAIFYLYMIQ